MSYYVLRNDSDRIDTIYNSKIDYIDLVENKLSKPPKGEPIAKAKFLVNRYKTDFLGFLPEYIVIYESKLDLINHLLSDGIFKYKILLPGDTQVVLLNIREVVDCLDIKHSQYTTVSDGTIISIEKYNLVLNKIPENVHVFKVKGFEDGDIIVSDKFVECVQMNKLKGLIFEKIA